MLIAVLENTARVGYGACIRKGGKCRVPGPMTVGPTATPHLICKCVTVRSLYVRRIFGTRSFPMGNGQNENGQKLTGQKTNLIGRKAESRRRCCKGHGTLTTILHSFNGSFSGTTEVSRYQKGKTSLDFTGARDSEFQWHQLGHMQVCTSLQTTTPATHHSVFYGPVALPAAQPTASKH